MHIIEVAFKGRRREYYANPQELPLLPGDYVVVQADRGEDLGRVHHTSEWIRREDAPAVLREVLRPGRPEDLERLDANRRKEERAFDTCRERIAHRDVEMKLVDCEYQFDGNRITFFFTAEKRVDFRDLVKDLASMFRTRIELRQIGVRDESGRIGGVGTCGRELCCATWLRDFQPITLKMAKDQGLSPSPSKISGACGRLKCCLRYELDFYKEAQREFPKLGSKLTLEDAEFEVARVDIFHRVLHLIGGDAGERTVALEALPPGTKIVGPTRDRRKGCDKKTCASRGTKPGDGSARPAEGRAPAGPRPAEPPRPEASRPEAPRAGAAGGEAPPAQAPRDGGPRPAEPRPEAAAGRGRDRRRRNRPRRREG